MISRDKDPIRVLMISPQFRPLVGGYERAAERLSGVLASAGLRVVVIAERRDRKWLRREFIDGYEVRRLFCLYRPGFHIITSLLAFAGYLLRHGREFDVWHVHQYGYHAAVVVLLGRLWHRPVVLKMTNTNAMGIEKVTGTRLLGLILGYLHRRVSACIAISNETREEAIRFGIPAERIHLIPNSVDGCRFRPALPGERAAARRALGLTCERLVLYLGRLSSEKNPLGLLDAWEAIPTKVRKGTLLVLVGDGPQWGRVQDRVQAPALRSSVHLAGKCNDVSIWYRAADLFVLPSINEGLSNSMLEALAAGLPVISTRVSGSSILQDPPASGCVVAVGDAQQLACAMESFLKNESMRTSSGKHARLAFESNFSMDVLMPKMVMLYENVLDHYKEGGKV